MKILISILLILFFNFSYSQEFKRNNQWMVGYYPAVKFDFSSTLQIDTLGYTGWTVLSFGSSCISDTNGVLSIFSNGFNMVGNDGNPILNWDSVNCALGKKFRDDYGGDGFFDQMSIILPKNNNEYYVFTCGMSDSAYDEWKATGSTFDDFRFDVLTYHIVNMDSNNGEGKIISKNNILMRDTFLSHNRMTAVKHGNGRDWWLVKPHKTEHKFYLFQVTPDSIYSPIIDTLVFPYVWLFGQSLDGQSCFSNDGKKYGYCTNDTLGNVYVSSFDRCNGDLYNSKRYVVPIDNINYSDDFTYGCCFSPNGKYLYITTTYYVYQINLEDTNTYNAVQVGHYAPLFPKLGRMQLAPNGRIYISNENGTSMQMCYIEFPDSASTACNFVPMGLTQPYTYLMSLPNMPNYGLGASDSPVCWPNSISQYANVQISQLVVFPNPTSSLLNINFEQEQKKYEPIYILDAVGKEVYKIKKPSSKNLVDVKEFSKGIYFVRYENEFKKIVIE